MPPDSPQGVKDEGERPQYFGRDLEAMAFAVNYHRWILREFDPCLGRAVAEVGAGAGSFTTLLLERVSELTAFEPSDNMFPRLTETVGERPGVTLVNDFFGSPSAHARAVFDTILYVNVLEHVEDHAGEAAAMYRALEPGGHALIFVPALDCLYSELDRVLGHFRRYHRKPLRALFERAGFEVVKCHYFDLAGIIPWYIAFVLMKKTIGPDQVSAYDRLVVPVMKILEGLVKPPIGKNLLLIARKPL